MTISQKQDASCQLRTRRCVTGGWANPTESSQHSMQMPMSMLQSNVHGNVMRYTAHKSEAEHVSDIKAGVRYRIVPEVTVQEMILKIALHNSESSCVSANKRTISDKVLKMLTKISQESVEKHDKSGKRVWRGL